MKENYSNGNIAICEENKKINNRVIYIDILNILACFCVIWLHCNGIVHTYSPHRYWATALIVEVIAYWAVPIFLMITGATLLNYREKYDTKTFAKKRIKRTVIPFLIWSTIILVWKLATHKMELTSYSPSNFISIYLNNSMENTYYFFISLFAVYMAIPILSLFTRKKEDRKYLWYMVILAFITKSCLPLICKMTNITWNPSLETPLVGGYLMFVLIGYLLSTQEMKKKDRVLVYIVGLLCAILRYGMTYYLSTRDGVINKMFFEYNYFTSVCLAVAVFVFIKNIKWSTILNDKIRNTYLPAISSCSLGIYLIHQAVMTYEIKFMEINTTSIIWRTAGAVMTYLISLMIIYILKKIPKIGKILVP